MAKTTQSAPPAKKNGGKNGGKSEKTEAPVQAHGNHNGYALDTTFIGKPHEWDPRRLYSQTGADWQYRVDFERLRKDRLAKMQAEMTKRDIGALVLFAGANVRYVTGSYQGNWKYNINIRYAVVPNGAEPVLFETAGSDLVCAKMDLPWMENRIAPAITWQWAEGAVPYMAGRMAQSVVDVLKEHGLAKERVGIDNLDMAALKAFTEAGVNIVDAWPCISAARVVKTRDEIELLKMASSIGDAAMWKIKYEWLKPGVREREIEAKVHEFMLERGCEIIYDIIVASGGNTSPYRRWATDKLIRQGDLVIVDINAVGPSGYFIDFVRCFKCAQKMNQKEIDLYREVYDSMYAGLEKLKPGNTTADVAHAFPVYDDDKYGTVTLQQFAHSIGLTLYEGMWISRAYSLKYPAEIKENMYFAIETFAGHPGLQQTARLEENVLVSGKGPVVFTMMEHMEEAMKR
ncbi:MAG TPA: Xaa-Pro peptidase family protein [Bryobacteraceae bacterium]|nr:Xaa-Pro peptidase family protein [Bryobacteraceae bacterium]